MTVRDTQRSKVYKAERDVFTYYPGRVLAGYPGATMGQMKFGAAVTVKQAQDLQDRIGANSHVANKWRAGKITKATVGVSRRRRRGSAASYGGEVQYHPDALLDWLVLHEMAHEVNREASHYYNASTDPEKYGRGDKVINLINGRPGEQRHYHASHGWRWCAIYLHLVRLYMGAEAHAALKASFDRDKVRYKEPRKGRVLTEEQKTALRERLAKARAAKLAA